jgi:hypothetical protein
VQAASSFCLGWVSAGGSLEDDDYLANCSTVKRLQPLYEKLAAEDEAVREAAREWCAQQGIPVDVFSGPLAFITLAPSAGTGVSIDQEFLDLVRSVFAGIKFAW